MQTALADAKASHVGWRREDVGKMIGPRQIMLPAKNCVFLLLFSSAGTKAKTKSLVLSTLSHSLFDTCMHRSHLTARAMSLVRLFICQPIFSSPISVPTSLFSSNNYRSSHSSSRILCFSSSSSSRSSGTFLFLLHLALFLFTSSHSLCHNLHAYFHIYIYIWPRLIILFS